MTPITKERLDSSRDRLLLILRRARKIEEKSGKQLADSVAIVKEAIQKEMKNFADPSVFISKVIETIDSLK